MPIYEYECDDCGHTLDIMQKISDPALTECPACHEHSLRKKLSAPAFHLKGSGWYATDFKDKPKTGATEKKDKEGTTVAREAGKEDKKSTSSENTKPVKKSEPASTE